MITFNFSELVEQGLPRCEDSINVFSQFFIHKVKQRANEMKRVLKMNFENDKIDKLYLLTERNYSDSELGIPASSSPKVCQHVIGSRLKYGDVFDFVTNHSVVGFNVIVNADIACDESIDNVRVSGININKKMFALLRYEYNYGESTIFGPRFDSQDSWIVHSNFNPQGPANKLFNFQLGKPGCDNKLIYMFQLLGFGIINDPSFIRTFHCHASQVRDYTNADYIPPCWGVVLPVAYKNDGMETPRMLNDFIGEIRPSLGINLAEVSKKTGNFQRFMFRDNEILASYITTKGSANFIIPRIAGIENNLAVFMKQHNTKLKKEQVARIMNMVPVMKNNAGICFDSGGTGDTLNICSSCNLYSQQYLDSFTHCELFAGWESYGNVYRYIAESHDFVTDKCNSENKRGVWAFAFDIFNYINNKPWTLALRGKRILIISAFAESIEEKIPIREKIYGIDLFPDCEITTIKPPQTQGSEPSLQFNDELDKFYIELDKIKDNYDVALVSSGGYGNIICNHIYKSGNSAIYIGGVLSMYFGVYGMRWMKERPEAMKLFMNKYWSRPKESERPTNYKNIENSAYW
jgi:hypothetical protein